MRRFLLCLLIGLLLAPSVALAVTDPMYSDPGVPGDPSDLAEWWIKEAEVFANSDPQWDTHYNTVTRSGYISSIDDYVASLVPEGTGTHIRDLFTAEEIASFYNPSVYARMQDAIMHRLPPGAVNSQQLTQMVQGAVIGTSVEWGGRKFLGWAVGNQPRYFLEDGTEVSQMGNWLNLIRGRKVYMWFDNGALQSLWDPAKGKWDGEPPAWAIATRSTLPEFGHWERLGQPYWGAVAIGNAPTPPVRGVSDAVLASGDSASQSDADLVADSLTRSLHDDQTGPIIAAGTWTWATYSYWLGGYNQRLTAPNNGTGVKCAVCGDAYVAFAQYAPDGQKEVFPTVYWDSRSAPSKPGYRVEWSWKDVYQIVQHLNTHGDWRSWFVEPQPITYTAPVGSVLPGETELPAMHQLSPELTTKMADGTATPSDYVKGITVPNVVPPQVDTQLDRPAAPLDPGEGVTNPTPDSSQDSTSALGIISGWAGGFWTNLSTFSRNLFSVSDDTVKSRISPRIDQLKVTAGNRWPFGLGALGDRIAPSIAAGGSEPIEWFIDLDVRDESEAGVWLRPLEWGTRWTWLRWVMSAVVGIAFFGALRALLSPKVHV